ncbi:MAG: sigma-70 family RNA polymerase sigma factor, partial [Sporomusaceae bacterium]|nr:sigma-70 family RNA polymerase sigma factor [Sporomusaceae bacterium]
MLSDKELRRLIKKAQQGSAAQRQAAADMIAEHNLNLVRSIVTRFCGRGYEWDDLFQIGSIGLLKSIERFDLTMNVKFSTYAVPVIIGEIKRFMRDDNSIKVSRPLKELALKIYKTREHLEKQTGREPKISEIAQELSVPKE